VPAIKGGDLAWKGALLERTARAPLPDFAREADLVCCAPTAWPRRWLRGFDLAEEAAALIARRLHRPFRTLLRKAWLSRPQAGQAESRRRLLPAAAVTVRGGQSLAGVSVLVVDDVWTTGTTLRRCAQALGRAGAADVSVLALFRVFTGDEV
jgi:competence protein ComFC